MSVVLKSVEALLGSKLEGCESASLRLEKFASPEEDRKQGEPELIVQCLNAGKSRLPSCSPVETAPLPKGAVVFHAKLEGRLLVNHAGGALENTGLCLHRFFGIPCIPGSALKGVARHAAWCAWDAETDPAKKDGIAREIAQIFGYPTNEDALDEKLEKLGFDRQSGCVSFLPAYPSSGEKFSFVTDLVNCHHKDYYGGGKARATDDESPVPNKFPAVESGPFFQFAIVPGVRATEQDVARARHWLIEAIINQGVGAKTAAGYGWFSFSEAANAEKIAAIRNARELTVRRGKVDALSTRLHALMVQAESLTASDIPELTEIRAGIDSFKCTDAEVSQQDRQWLLKRIDELTPRKAEDLRIKEDWMAALNKNGGNDKKLREWINKKCPQLATGKFERLTESTKSVVVRLLQSDETGRRLWDFIKSNGGHQAVSAYLKSHPELGKKP